MRAATGRVWDDDAVGMGEGGRGGLGGKRTLLDVDARLGRGLQELAAELLGDRLALGLFDLAFRRHVALVADQHQRDAGRVLDAHDLVLELRGQKTGEGAVSRSLCRCAP